MMKYPYLVIALLVIFGAIDIVILGNQFGLDATTWPGWVQALGSIAALGVAIFVMSRQNAHAAKLALSADIKALRRRGESVFVLIQHADSVLQNANVLIENILFDADTTLDAIDMALKVSRGNLEEVRRVLVAVPAHELGAYEMTASLQKVIGAITEILHMIEPQDYSALYHMRDEHVQLAHRLHESVTSARDAFDASLKSFR